MKPFQGLYQFYPNIYTNHFLKMSEQNENKVKHFRFILGFFISMLLSVCLKRLNKKKKTAV